MYTRSVAAATTVVAAFIAGGAALAPSAAVASPSVACGPGTPGAAELARTGFSPVGSLLVAAGLLVLGALALVAARRGRRVGGAVLGALLVIGLVGALGVVAHAPTAGADPVCGTGVSPATAESTTTAPGATSTTAAAPTTTTIPGSTTTAPPTTTTSTTTTPTTTTTAPLPLCEDGSLMPINDKSDVIDHDSDGKVDRCDDDSDADGIPDTVEDLNHNGIYNDDDVDGDHLVIAMVGDGVSSYLDLDSDNDSVLDATEGGGNTDGDDKPNFVDAKSNGTDYDLYLNCFDELDILGGGFIVPSDDPDGDGVQTPVDSTPAAWGATQTTGC